MDRITIVSPDGEVKEMANIKHIVSGYLDNGWSVRCGEDDYPEDPSPVPLVGHPEPVAAEEGKPAPKTRARKPRKEG